MGKAAQYTYSVVVRFARIWMLIEVFVCPPCFLGEVAFWRFWEPFGRIPLPGEIRLGLGFNFMLFPPGEAFRTPTFSAGAKAIGDKSSNRIAKSPAYLLFHFANIATARNRLSGGFVTFLFGCVGLRTALDVL
jgi:hypothetical protein